MCTVYSGLYSSAVYRQVRARYGVGLGHWAAWLLTHAACLAAREQGQGGALTTLSTPSSI